MLLFVSWRNKYAIIEWPLFDAFTSTHGVFLVLVYLGTVAYISVEISLGTFWRRDILRVKGKHYSQIATFYDSVWYAIVEWPPFEAPSGTHGVFTSLVYLSAVAYISVEISLGS